MPLPPASSPAFRKLEAALRARAVVRLLTETPDDSTYSAPFGVPVALGEQLVILQFLRDFRRDGYVAVPVERVVDVVRGEFERVYRDICREEGVLDRIGAAPGGDAAHLTELFIELRRRNRYVLITLSDGQILLGRLRGTGETTVRLLPFDATGTWLPPLTLPLTSILDVQWSARYLRVWQRYMEEI